MMEEQQTASLDALLRQAQRAEPTSLSPYEARRAIRAAVQSAERSGRAQRWAWLVAACLTVVVAAFVTRGFFGGGTRLEVAAEGRPLRVALASGDALIAAPGTALEIVAQEAARRVVRLETGRALFDVQKLSAGQQFDVFTDAADVHVRGTVFSVEIHTGRTVVRVYEGTVWVSNRTLGAGQTWVSSGAAASFESDPLASEGETAAAIRIHAPALRVSTLPDVRMLPDAVTHDAGAPAAAASASATSVPEALSIDEVRAWLLAGDAERALAAALEESRREQPAFQLLAADALRALHRHAEAVDGYQRVAARDPAVRASAGYAAASLALYELHEATRALGLLDTLALDGEPSSLRERASVLRVDALLALDRRDEAKAAARRYLAREPETRVSQRMRALAR